MCTTTVRLLPPFPPFPPTPPAQSATSPYLCASLFSEPTPACCDRRRRSALAFAVNIPQALALLRPQMTTIEGDLGVCRFCFLLVYWLSS